MDILIKLLRELGFLISWKKVVGPSQRITFLGVEIDTTSSTLSLGKDKLQQLQQQLQHFGAHKHASKQQLQSFVGSLNWACQAIQGGRFFLWRILDTLQPLQQQRHKARLSADFKQDVQWWLSFIYTFIGSVNVCMCMLTLVTWQQESFGKGSGHTLCSTATCLQQPVSTSTTKKYGQWFAQWKTGHIRSMGKL